MSRRAIVRAAALFILVPCASPLGAFEPRALTAAERGAVEVALGFAARGPGALDERLADGAPLAWPR